MARVQLVYPKIPGSRQAPEGRCIAFEKYDGANMHWVWDRELGWHAFGTRRHRYELDVRGIREFAAAHEGMETGPLLFLRDFARPLAEIFRAGADYDCAEVIVFTEFLGPGSFAGRHREGEAKQLVLFDVQTAAGIVPPEQFARDFAGLNIARVVYRGRLTGKFIHDVRSGKYDVGEGVVCKGVAGEETDRENRVWMVKIKTDAYLQRLKDAFGDGWREYWE